MESTVTLIKARREQLVSIRAELKELVQKAKMERIMKNEAKKAERIAKLEARLASMKAPKVGSKALKANRKPGPVTVTKG